MNHNWYHNEQVVLNQVNPSVEIMPKGGDYRHLDVFYVKGEPVQLTEHFYNTIYLEREHFRLSPEEFAEQIIERGLRALAELITARTADNTDRLVAYAAPKPTGRCGGYITRGTITYRWFIHEDEYGSPVSTIDVLFGSIK